MKLLLQRTHYSVFSTIGKLNIENNSFSCFTLEDTERMPDVKVKTFTAIPRGTYQVILSFSNRFQKITPEILNVPHFTGIRIHSGNIHTDTEGCILVGQRADFKIEKIFDSGLAFEALMRTLEEVNDYNEDMVIEIIGGNL